MIEHKFIPDGGSEVPAEAKDPEVLWDCLQDHKPSDSRVRRLIPGHGRHIKLSLDGSTADYTQTELDELVNCVEGNINGLKAHPSGWVEVNEEY